MERPEYMQMKLKDLLQEFIDMYNLIKIAEEDGNVYIWIQKGMYGLPQAGILAQQQLEQQLNKHGYHQSPLTPQNTTYLFHTMSQQLWSKIRGPRTCRTCSIGI